MVPYGVVTWVCVVPAGQLTARTSSYARWNDVGTDVDVMGASPVVLRPLLLLLPNIISLSETIESVERKERKERR
ncbi:hypothetical protein GCM10015535_68040 [Streptomyces gelaticus]|uniref:Uncharacterized protein n=1 Tax=Streptomyces gelaticus TaxID=285446 RepID=A0ABQ2W969_9ACTN|nr:hypothetical protein GCM10015535_68040 [Streptomyces gelaticus]